MSFANSLSYINKIILFVLSLGALVFVVDMVGFLPSWLEKWIAKNRLETTLRALKSLGVMVAWDNEKPSTHRSFSKKIRGSEPLYKKKLKMMIEEASLGENAVEAGEKRSFTVENYVDIMGNSTNSEKAKDYARILYAYIVDESLLNNIDFIATPKEGSPILGYEVSHLLKKPLVLGVCHKGKSTSENVLSHLSLDYDIALDLREKRALLIDDSTTGGRVMLDLAAALRKDGAIVKDACVLFEPIGKNARTLLRNDNIILHAVVNGPNVRV